MAVSEFMFTDAGWLATIKGTIDLENDTIVAVLIDNAQTPALATDATWADISANECSDADYTGSFPEGLTMTALAWTDTGARTFKLDAADLDFGNTVTISARYVYLVKRAGATLVAGDLIVGYVDLNSGGSTNVSSTAGNFDLAWATAGMYVETLSP
jgi:hypothetical protein